MIGDYVAGVNHVLPTAGTARFASALARRRLPEARPRRVARRRRARRASRRSCARSPKRKVCRRTPTRVRLREDRARASDGDVGCDSILPRDDLRALEGYHSPQVDVAVRLNTNESPYPPPDAFVDALARRAARRRLPPLPGPRRERAARRASASSSASRRRACSARTARTRCCRRCCSPTAAPGGRRRCSSRRTRCTRTSPGITGTEVVVGERGRRLLDRRRRRRGAASRPSGRASCSCAARTTRPAPSRPRDDGRAPR